MDPEPNPPTGNDLEVVIETTDLAEVAVVKSLFESAEIPYLTRSEDQFDAFRGAFRGTVFSSLGRPVVFLVPADRAPDARSLLSVTPEETD